MTGISYKIVNEKKIMALLEGLKDPSFLKKVHHRAGVTINTQMKKYPPPPAGSRYRRTGTLGRRWNFRVKANLFSVTTTIGNNTSYGPLVQGQETQAEVHRGRWQTDEQVLAQESGAIEEEVFEAIDEQIGGS